jgi:DNA repair protein RadC
MTKILDAFNEVELSYKRPPVSEMPKIEHRIQLIKYLRELAHDTGFDMTEQVWVALMTTDKHLLGISRINIGSIRNTAVNVRAIFQLALVSNAVNIAIIHNHPSGNLNISDADIEIAKSIQSVGKLLDVTLTDAIVITSESHRSYYRLL